MQSQVRVGVDADDRIGAFFSHSKELAARMHLYIIHRYVQI